MNETVVVGGAPEIHGTPGLAARFAVGASAGLCLAAAPSVARFLTSRPHFAFLVLFDALTIAGGMGLAVALFGGLSPWSRGDRARSLPLRSCVAMAVWIFGIGFFELRLRHGLLLAAGLFGAALLLPRLPRRARVPFPIFVPLLAVMLCAGLIGQVSHSVPAWLFPTGLVALLALNGKGPDPRAPSRWASPGLAGVVVLSLCALLPPPAPLPLPRSVAVGSAPPTAQRSVILIVLDTLRRDRMSLYGHERRTTPQLDAWARDALVFDDMSATSSWTLPSHASMFTGLFPRSHGARGYRGKGDEVSRYALRRDVDTLAEVASRAGVQTAAIVANHYLLGPEWGLDQGFREYYVLTPRHGLHYRPADWLAQRLAPDAYDDHNWPYYRAHHVTDLAIDWLQDRSRVPHFLFLNYMDVHRPNWRSPGPEIPMEDERLRIPAYATDLPRVLAHEPMSESTWRGLTNAYDRELLALDAEVGRLLAYLEESGRAEDTTVLVTSDHGEYFGEHDLIDHMVFLYNEVVDVPLIVKGPGVSPGRSSLPVQSVDLYPTLLELLGIEPADPRQGRSIFEGRRRAVVSEWYSASDPILRQTRFRGRFDHDLFTIRLDRLRLHAFADGRAELYDLGRDPRETRDLAAEQPGDVARLRTELEAWRAAHPLVVGVRPGERPRESSDLELIHALGYGGSATEDEENE